MTGLWWCPSLWVGQGIAGVAGLSPPGAAARAGEVFSPLGGEGMGWGEGTRTKLLFFSLFPLFASNNLLPSLLLSFPLHPSILHDLSRTTFVGPVSAAAPEGTLGRKRRRGVSVPVLRCISVQSPTLTSGPNPALGRGVTRFRGALKGPFSIWEEELLEV